MTDRPAPGSISADQAPTEIVAATRRLAAALEALEGAIGTIRAVLESESVDEEEPS
mgnify:CR=1 FL=1